MRISVPKLFTKKRKWEFQKANLIESTDELSNPVRGWYRIFPFYVEERPDFVALMWCEKESDTIALVIINIGAFRDEKLSAEGFTKLKQKNIINYITN